jgi:hypothetical protein
VSAEPQIATSPPPAVEPKPAEARRARALARAGVIALLLYVGYALFLTWPLAADPGGSISAPGISGDLGGSVATVAYVVQHHVFPFAPGTLHGLDAPQGLPVPWVLNWADAVGRGLLYSLGYVFGAVTGHAFYLWIGLVGSGLAMFLLTRRLFGNTLAGLLAGFAFGFSPWAVQGMSGHYDYIQGWVLVLAMWRMLELAMRPTLRNGLLAGAATVVAMLLTAYFILIAGVGFAAMVIVVLASAAARQQLVAAVKAVAAAVVPIVVVFGAIGALTAIAGSGSTGEVRTQSISELYTYSARWLEWFLPDRNNLIFGGVTSPYLTSHLHGSNFSESSLYLGLSVVALALAGLGLSIVRVRQDGRAAGADIRVVAAVGGIVVAVAAALFSAPPKVHLLGVWVPMPSFFVFHVTSTWRVYTRFVELIELGLSVPLAFALARLFARPRPIVTGLLFLMIAAILVLDLWARPPIRTTKIVVPREYVWLKNHPGGIVADYPLEPAVFPNYAPLFWQPYDGHPLFQGYDASSETESMKLDMVNLQENTTGPYLADLGVRYIIVHPGQPGGGLAELERHGYVPRFAGPDGTVLQVGARPAPTRVDALSGFSLVEGAANGEYRWMTGPGVLGVYARNCQVCSGIVTFKSSSADLPRVLTVREQSTGAVLARVRVPPGRLVPVVVANVLLHDGQARLLLSTDIPALLPKDGDPRLLSVNVMEPRLSLTEQ